MKRRSTLLFLFILLSLCSRAQEAPSDTLDQEEGPAVSYIPKIDGAIKAKVEFDLTGGEYRFNVRNSRFGVSGNVSRNMTYRIQVDFNNEGKVSILDSYVGYKIGGFDVKFGQQQYRFSSDLDRGPSTNLFANRSFLAKYLTSYYGSEIDEGEVEDYVQTLGSRDLGALFSYAFRTHIPLKLYAGIFNGSGSNNPEWSRSVNVNGRVELGGEEGFRGSVSYYHGHAPRHDHIEKDDDDAYVAVAHDMKMRMMGVELRYVRGNFFAEGEYARRYLGSGNELAVLTAALVHTYYKIPLPKKAFADHIAPIVRWDMGNDVDYLDMNSKRRGTFSANRITAGVNLGFGVKMIRAELRLNYEKYFLRDKPSDFAANKLLHDKFTVEVVAAF